MKGRRGVGGGHGARRTLRAGGESHACAWPDRPGIEPRLQVDPQYLDPLLGQEREVGLADLGELPPDADEDGDPLDGYASV